MTPRVTETAFLSVEGVTRGAWEAAFAHAHSGRIHSASLGLRPASKQEKARRLVVCDFTYELSPAGDNPVPTGLLVADRERTEYHPFTSPADYGEEFPAFLAAHGGGQTLWCFWRGATLAFHTLLRHLAPALALAGWTVRPYYGGSGIKAVEVERARERFFLASVGEMVGVPDDNSADFLAAFDAGGVGGRDTWGRVLDCLYRVQSLTLAAFGVGLRGTVGALGVAAARHYLDASPEWWRPSSLLDSVCRVGGGYRGGYKFAEPYRGPAWRLDANRLYSWALTLPLPSRASVGPCVKDGTERAGVYMCEVAGVSAYPVYLPIYTGEKPAFRRVHATRGSFLCFLPSDEFAGLRAMGWTVRPGMGFVTEEWVSLRPLIDRITVVLANSPRSSPQYTLAKQLANSLAGKLAEDPWRTQLAFAMEPPSPDWLPYVSEHDDILPHVWMRRVLEAKPTNHIDAAAAVTARGRSRVYSLIGEWVGRGGRVVYVDTDGLLVTSDPCGVIPLDPSTPGAFRADGFDADSRVLAKGVYSFDGRDYHAGLPGAFPGSTFLWSVGGKPNIRRVG